MQKAAVSQAAKLPKGKACAQSCWVLQPGGFKCPPFLLSVNTGKWSLLLLGSKVRVVCWLKGHHLWQPQWCINTWRVHRDLKRTALYTVQVQTAYRTARHTWSLCSAPFSAMCNMPTFYKHCSTFQSGILLLMLALPELPHSLGLEIPTPSTTAASCSHAPIPTSRTRKIHTDTNISFAFAGLQKTSPSVAVRDVWQHLNFWEFLPCSLIFAIMCFIET